MKKTRIYIGAFALFCTGALFAQGEMDAFRFSQQDLNGSARSMSMGGAFGALGGDMSAMSHNPAGIGVYRSSEVQATLDLKMATMSSSWTGINTDKNRTNFNFDNFSYVGYFPTGRDTGPKSWNIGFSYNKVKDFNREYRSNGTPGSSMADYVASRATNAFGKDGGIFLNELDNDPYGNNDLYGNWLPIIGYRGGFIVPKTDNENNDIYHSAYGKSPNKTTLRVFEKGSIDEYNFSFATNISDRIFIGATVGITDIDYRMVSSHDEDFGGKDYLSLYNSLETEGTGYSFNLGVIARPIDMLRLGIAYNSPKWYRMTDYYYAQAESYLTLDNGGKPDFSDETPEGSYGEYKLRTPDRWIFSAAGIIGTSGMISVDYELTNYKSMHLSNRNGEEYGDNDLIKEDFTLGHTVKIGGEYKVTPQFAVRAGYIWQPSPMKDVLTSSNRNDLVEILPSGTIPHYTVLNTTNHYTIGLGYRFTPNFYMDVACIYRVQNEKLYPFSNTYWSYPDDGIHPVASEPAKVDAKTTRVALTVGYKF